MNLRIIYSNLFIISLLFLIQILLLNNNFIYNFIWPTENIFQDLIMPVKWLECHKAGIDIFKSSLCAGGTFAYGPMFLNLPINDVLKIFYLDYLPYLSLFLLITFIVVSFNRNNLLSLLLVILCTFNPSTMLLLQRMNLDIIIFLLIVFFSFNKFFILNWSLIFFLTFSKIYPIISGLIIFFENEKRSLKKIFMIIIGIALLSLIYLIINLQTYIDFFNGLSANKAGYHFLFSLNAMPKILKYSFGFNYILSIIVIYLSFFLLIKILFKKFSHINFDQIKYYNYEFKIFILGSTISLISFILFSNYFHREVFLILTIPFIISLYNFTKSKFLKYFIIFMIFK